MHWRGFRNLCSFYVCWLGGSFIIPVALGSLYFGITLPLFVLLGYYSFRFLFPAKKSEWIRQYFISDNTPYCRSSKSCCTFLFSHFVRIIFDEGAEAPKPYSKTLLSVAPHGILTLGWSYCISSLTFYNCDVKWLVAPAMMQLPFVSDVMQ